MEPDNRFPSSDSVANDRHLAKVFGMVLEAARAAANAGQFRQPARGNRQHSARGDAGDTEQVVGASLSVQMQVSSYPVNLFQDRSRDSKFASAPIDGGIGPQKALFLPWNVARHRRYPI